MCDREDEYTEVLVETYRGCKIYECAYENLFYTTKLPDGMCAGAETIEEIKEMIDECRTHHNN